MKTHQVRVRTTKGRAYLGRAPNLAYTPMFRKHIKGELSEQCLWTNYPIRSEVPVLRNVHDNEGTVQAQIHAAPEDLPVPNKFADALPATTKNHEVSWS